MEEGRDDVMASDPSDDAVVHPLHTGWTLWFDAGGGASRKSYGSGLRQIATVTTIQQFWSVLQNVQPLPPPSGNYYLFRVGITPAWEAVENQHGGKWVLVTRRDKTQAAWTATCVAAIAEQLESEYHDDLVCGVVVSARKNQDRLAVWTRIGASGDGGAGDAAALAVGHRWKATLRGTTKLSFSMHGDTVKSGGSSFGARTAVLTL